MYWFIVLFPLMIYPWGLDPSYADPKLLYLKLFVLCYWINILVSRKFRVVYHPIPNLTVEIIIFTYLCLVSLSTLFSIDKFTSFYGASQRYEGLLSICLFASVFLFSYRFFDIKKLEKIFLGIALVSWIASIYGILQHYLLDFLPRGFENINSQRSYSFFDNANFFGSYLVLIIMLSITLYLTSKNKKIVFISFLTISFAFISLIFSGTRSGWVGVFCGILFVTFYIIYKRKYLWKKWILVLLTLGVILIGINISEKDQYYDRIGSVVSDTYKIASNQSSGQEGSFRIFIWKKSLPLVKSNFWLGSGPDTFQYVFPNDIEKKNFFGDIIVDKAHNEYLQIAITMGVPALIAYIMLIAVVLRRAFLATKFADNKEKVLLYGMISAIIGYLIQAFFNICVIPVAPLFWSILGLTLAKSEGVLQFWKIKNSKNDLKDRYFSA